MADCVYTLGPDGCYEGYPSTHTPPPPPPTPTAVPPTPTAPSILPTQTGTIPLTSYFPDGFTEYAESLFAGTHVPLPPGESTFLEPSVVLVVVNPEGQIGRQLYCAVDSYQNSQNPPFDYSVIPAASPGATTSATICLEGPRLVRVGENLYQVQVDPYGTVATVSLDDDLAQSATPYVFAVNADGFIGDQTSGIIGPKFLMYLDTGLGVSSADQLGSALVEGVVLAPTPVQDEP